MSSFIPQKIVLEWSSPLNTGGGHEKIVSGVGDNGVDDVGGQGELSDHEGENGMDRGEVDLQFVDNRGGHEIGEPCESLAQNGGSSE